MIAPDYTTPLTLELLPPGTREIAETIGLPATLKAVNAWGGSSVWIPAEWKVEALTVQRLIVVLGEEAAHALWGVYRNSSIDIAKCDAAIRVLRDQEIVERRAQGETVTKLALMNGLTERQIYSILADSLSNKVDDRQIGLFDE